MKSFNIGIDMGGVLSVHDNKNKETINSEHKNTAINMPYSIESLQLLKEMGHDLFLVSFCGKNRAIDTRNSIKNNNLNILFEQQYYVKSKQFKNDVCKHIGCHFMIDDNEDVLDNVKLNNDKIITVLFGGNNHLIHKCAKDWKDVVDIIKSTEYFNAIKIKNNIDNFLY
jgi:hypothetical protein